MVSRHLQRDSLTSSFPIWSPCISFPSLIAVARTSRTMLKSSAESGHPSLVLDLSGNSFSFSALRMMFDVGLIPGLPGVKDPVLP